MIPVSNSGSLANKALAGGRKNAGAGQAARFSQFYSDEEMKYADPGAPQFVEEQALIPAASAPGSAVPENRSVGRNRFHEFMESNAVALAATQANNQQSLAPASQTPPQKQPTWSISLVGGQVAVSLNPNAR